MVDGRGLVKHCGALNVTNPRQIDGVRCGFLPLPWPVHSIPRRLRSGKQELEQQGAEAVLYLGCSFAVPITSSHTHSPGLQDQGLEKVLFGVIWLLKNLLPALS